jgi:hypothetical protein
MQKRDQSGHYVPLLVALLLRLSLMIVLGWCKRADVDPVLSDFAVKARAVDA